VWKHRLAYTFTDTDRINFDPTLIPTETFYSTGRDGHWEYQGTVDVAKGYQAVFGLESDHSQLNTASPSPFDPSPAPLKNGVWLHSEYGQIEATPIPAVTVTAGLRHDHHQTFGGKTTGRAALAWSVIGDSTLLRASYGEGFKAPTLYELYSPYGNLALQPEFAQGWDAGVEQHLLSNSVVLTATYFHRVTTNQIEFIDCFRVDDPRCTAQPFGFYDNVGRATAHGVELIAVAKLGERLSVDANYTHTDSVDDDARSADFGLQLARRPHDTVNGEVKYRWLGVETAVTVSHVSKSFDDAANLVPLGAYTLVGLRANRTLFGRYEIFGRIDNILDEHYETTYGYGSIGTSAFVGLRVTF
jgi:vitamin B12 transporter